MKPEPTLLENTGIRTPLPHDPEFVRLRRELAYMLGLVRWLSFGKRRRYEELRERLLQRQIRDVIEAAERARKLDGC